MSCGALPRRQDRTRRLLDLFDPHAPEDQELPARVHDAPPAQLGDPPQLARTRASARAQEPSAARRDVAQPYPAPAVAAEVAREPQDAARGIAPAPVPRSAEITDEAEGERARQAEAAAPLVRADRLPRLTAREHVEQ